MTGSYNPIMCPLDNYIPFLMDDSFRWKAFYYKSGAPCTYTLFARRNDPPDGDVLNEDYTGNNGNWGYYTSSFTCDNKENVDPNFGRCTEKLNINNGEKVTGKAQSSSLSILGTNGPDSESKFIVKDVGLGAIQEWSLPKYLEPMKEDWGSVLTHGKVYPELTPPWIRGSRLGIRIAFAYTGGCPACYDYCCNTTLSCSNGESPPISGRSGTPVLRSPCEIPCADPYTVSIGKPLGNIDVCWCAGTTPVSVSDYTQFLNIIVKNDVFGGRNPGYTQLTNKKDILDLWNINMERVITRHETPDSIHKYYYTYNTDMANMPVVNVTYHAAIWYIKWLRSGFLDPFRYSASELSEDTSKANCDSCIQTLIDTPYTWMYSPSYA